MRWALTAVVIVALALMLWWLMRPQPVPVPTVTPMAPTQTPMAPMATATPTPMVTTTPMVLTHTPTSQPTATAPVIPTATPTPSCRTGVITAHAAIQAVLETKPERACDGCTYYASVMCQDIGKRYTLHVAGDVIPVVVVDCATWAVGEWPQKQGQDWLGELDINSWPNMPIVPLEAALCE